MKISVWLALECTGRVEVTQGAEFGLRWPVLILAESWRPRALTFRHAGPRSAAGHRPVYGDVVVFGQVFNDIVCHAADPVMARNSQRLLERDPGAHPSMTERVRRLIVLLLPRGHCRAEVVAQHLGVDRRTVANHLAAERTTCSDLVDQMRQDLLARYLEDGPRALSEVALLLGFSELSAFSRWHRKRFGVAARTMRHARLS